MRALTLSPFFLVLLIFQNDVTRLKLKSGDIIPANDIDVKAFFFSELQGRFTVDSRDLDLAYLE